MDGLGVLRRATGSGTFVQDLDPTGLALAFFANALGGVLHQAPHERRIEMRRFAGDRDIMVRLHRDIYDAIASGDPAAAAIAVDEHFAAYDRLANAAHGSIVLSGPHDGTTRSKTTRGSADAFSPD